MTSFPGSDSIQIVNPNDPSHLMTLCSIHEEIEVIIHGVTLALSSQAIQVTEEKGQAFPSVYYLPQEDVNMALLKSTTKQTRCPLKGESYYLDLHLPDQHLENAAWSYHQVLHFDSHLKHIQGRIAFDTSNYPFEVRSKPKQ